MITGSRIVYLFLYVRDLETSRKFYESTLGLRVIEEDADAVKFDGGQIIIALNRAEDYGIELPSERDHSTDIVFLVDSVDEGRAALEARGVSFTETHRYEIGAITDFYDPDGHWFTLYETSDEAMTWPSGDRIGVVRKLSSNGDAKGAGFRLDGKPVIYLFLFVRDAKEAFDLYAGRLGLRDLEGGPCSRASTADEEGVVKWDTGGVILTTHALETVREEDEIIDHPCPPRTVNPTRMGGKAVVFHSPDIERSVAELTAGGVRFRNGISRSAIGATAAWEDPSGHAFFLYEPSESALQQPSGVKLQEILATNIS
jgi:catechol 2,3-dioxygenase-like lactoylglutathione lyase family enzyme